MVSGSFRTKTLHTHVQMVKELSSAQTWSYSVQILHTLFQKIGSVPGTAQKCYTLAQMVTGTGNSKT